VPKPATSANPVEIRLSHLWEIEVDDHVDGLDVDTSGKEVAAHEITTQASSEIMENPVPVSLGHLGVDVVAGVTKFGDLLGQQLNPLCRVAKNDALVDLQFGEKRIETMNLLTLLHESVVLGDTLQGELVHQINLIWVPKMLPHEGLHGEGKSRGIQQDLPARGKVADHPI